MYTVNERDFEKFVADNYPDGETFLTHSEKRERFNRQNSQIVVNKIPVAIVFIGDSITEAWETGLYFGRYGNIVNRGIGGERLSELTVRFKADCLDLKPSLCVLASGINDTYPLYKRQEAGETLTEEDYSAFLTEKEGEYDKLIAMARKNGTEIWLASVLPLGTHDFRTELILRLNERIKAVCARTGATYIDYHSALTESDGKTLKNVTFGDMLHPHVKGYNVMYGVLESVIEKKKRGVTR